MTGIEFEVLNTFVNELHSEDDVARDVVDRLAQLLAAAKLPKPDQLVALYTNESGESAL